MLENEDIQHILLTRTPALTGRYEFLSFRNAAGGRAWLSAIREKAQSAAEVMASVEKDKRWVRVAFTWNGLRALGVDEGSLATFPEEFKQGMVARAEMLGDTGENHPDNWVGGLASPDLHAIAILFARDAAERARCLTEHDKLVAQCEGVAALSALDLEATPPLTMRTTTSATATGSRSLSSKAPAKCPRPAPARRSSRANSFSDTRTKTDRPPICRNPKSCHATAATWPIVACKSMWAGFAISCASTARHTKNRS
jgi:hypothetical protein